MTRRGRRSKTAIERRNLKRYGTKTAPPTIAYRILDRPINMNTPKWIENTFPIETPHPIYGSEWNKQRELALKRDSHICQYRKCNETENLHIHHIIPFRMTQDNSLDNLITLCQKHHKMVEGKVGEELSNRMK